MSKRRITSTFAEITGITRIELDSGEPGPTVALTAGIHGDETAPIAFLSCLAQGAIFPSKGRLAMYPSLCPEAILLGSRYTRRGEDLNRCFGGEGSTMAADILVEILPTWTDEEEECRWPDLVLDLHEHHGGLPYEHPSAWAYAVERETPRLGGAAGTPVREVQARGTLMRALTDRRVLSYTLETSSARLSRAEQMRAYLWMVLDLSRTSGIGLQVEWASWRWRG
jgi:predicted deacylase